MNDTFREWLVSDNTSPCCFRERGYFYTVVRVKKNEDFDYLFYQKQYSKEGSTARGSSFEYAGIYCRKDGLLYDVVYGFIYMEENQEPLLQRSAEALQEQLKVTVRKKVEAAINNDRNNLQVMEITDKELLSQLEDACSCRAKERARQHYLDTEDFEPPVFQCNYMPKPWQEDFLLDYILDPEGYAQQQAEEFIASNQEEMLYEFLYEDAVLKKYKAIVERKKDPVHVIKKIMLAVGKTAAKTVNVTIRKDGTEFTFKTKIDPLCCDCRSYYDLWHIVAADRQKFEQLFGRNADYKPKEILRITYGRKVLYEAGK